MMFNQHTATECTCFLSRCVLPKGEGPPKEKAPEGAFSHVKRQTVQLSNNTSEPIADIQPDITSGFRQAGDAGALAVALVVLVEQVVDYSDRKSVV